jgi:polyhydroxybutyrate depolymerase
MLMSVWSTRIMTAITRTTPVFATAAGLALALTLLVACGGSNQHVACVGPTTSTTGSLPKGSTAHDLKVGDTVRSYLTYVPASIDPATPVPLVVMLHGGFGSAKQAEGAYGWNAKADAEGFVVLYPDGEDGAWNAGTCCGKPATGNVDDVAFIEQAVQAVETQQRIDPRRAFAAGISNGAMMSYRLVCQTGIFAAVAPVAGARMVACENPTPVSVLHIHGLADTHVPLDGSPGSGLGKVPMHTPVTEVLAGWRKVDGCGQPTQTKVGVVTTSTATCPDGRSVTFVTIDGAGHQWPGAVPHSNAVTKLLGSDTPSTAISATDVVWDFFAAHPAPA